MFNELTGFVGVIAIFSAYFLLQFGKLSSNSAAYSSLNLIGAGLVLISLMDSHQYAAILLEVLWLLVSIYGLHKAINLRRFVKDD